MTDRDLDRITASYLRALDRGDFATLDRIWERAATHADLEQALQELHAALDAEDEHEAERQAATVVTAAVGQHLPSAEIVRPASGPVTVADVADELFRHTPDRLPPEAHLLNEKLRSARSELPADLGLSKLVAWAEARFGPAPEAYWKAFRQAALKLELRRAAEAEYQLAARPGQPKPGGKP
jgi:hypothetical protein